MLKGGQSRSKKSGCLEDIQKNHEIDIQELTDEFIKTIDQIITNKEKEILT